MRAASMRSTRVSGLLTRKPDGCASMEIADLVQRSHAYAQSRGFWDVETINQADIRNEGLLLSLVASEAFEALSEHRAGLPRLGAALCQGASRLRHPRG